MCIDLKAIAKVSPTTVRTTTATLAPRILHDLFTPLIIKRLPVRRIILTGPSGLIRLSTVDVLVLRHARAYACSGSPSCTSAHARRFRIPSSRIDIAGAVSSAPHEERETHTAVISSAHIYTHPLPECREK